jgi:hypothetical protein
MLFAILASTLNIALYRSAVAYRPPTLLLACAWREKRREEENIEKKKK